MTAGSEKTVGFVLIEGFALMSATSAIEPLRAANLLSGSNLYRTRLYSEDGGWIASSCGGAFETEPMAKAAVDFDVLFVVAGGDPLAQASGMIFSHLRALNVRGVPLGGISGGAVYLAKAGVMENRRFTVHWEYFEELQALNDRFLMERRLFVIDRDRYTCAGGVAPLDMMHAIIRSDHGAELARSVSDWFIHTGIRSAEDPQRLEFADSRQSFHASVDAAVELMETHIADPLSLEQIAMLSGSGVRQLQRRFDEQFGRPIMQVYMQLRLKKADELVRKTRLSFMEVALATGFTNQSHFGQAFRTTLGMTPRDRRKQAASEFISEVKSPG
ncbi:GlxA family transcriptional regulator [Roseibium sp. MMSF_3412]|uniref:GlxA family transcriptional regulator n=1 Tax=Roseibium sp. MMSF_3412 TaxID=3046712 RepID=UPI00273DBEBA|nr:GlxA family transcriptional regulator [Roseibium sp. MMSF_3412]